MADDKSKPLKSYYPGSSFTGIINTWRLDGHQSCQLRLSSDHMAAVHPVEDLGSMVPTENGTAPKFSDAIKAFANYGTIELRRSDFYTLLPILIALGRMDGVVITVEYGKEVPFKEE